MPSHPHLPRLSCRPVTVTIREDEPEDILPHEYFLRRIYKNVHPKGFKPFLTPPTAGDVGEPFAAPPPPATPQPPPAQGAPFATPPDAPAPQAPVIQPPAPPAPPAPPPTEEQPWPGYPSVPKTVGALAKIVHPLIVQVRELTAEVEALKAWKRARKNP